MTAPTTHFLYDSKFVKLVSAQASRIIVEMVSEGVINQRPLTQQEKYVRNVLRVASEILIVCDQMAYTIQLLSGYRSQPNFEPLLTRFDYIRYQVENHTIRTGMVSDRSLQLVNAVFVLGIPPRECKFPVVAKNDHVAETPVADALEKLQSALQPSKTRRNLIVHRESYQDEGLYEVELYSVLEKSSKRSPDPVLQLAANVAKPKADKFIQAKRTELQSIIEPCAANELFLRLAP